MKTKQKVIEKLKKTPISNIAEAIKFLEERENAQKVIDVDWKWEVVFEGDDNYKFYSDEELIEWCQEQRDTYFNEE